MHSQQNIKKYTHKFEKLLLLLLLFTNDSFYLYDLYPPRQGHTFPRYGDLESDGWEKDVQCNVL